MTLTLATMSSVAPGMVAAAQRVFAGPPMDVAMVFGFFGSFLTVVLWIYRRQSRAYALALAVCLAAMSAYGFVCGAWALGVVVGVCCVAAIQQWREEKRVGQRKTRTWRRIEESRPQQWNSESRISRMFGPG